MQQSYAALTGEYALSRTPAGPINPFTIPNVYTDPQGSGEAVVKIRYDGVAALNFAIRYRLTGDESAAVAARNQIAPWLTVTGFDAPAGSDTRLVWSDTWPFFIAAGMMIEQSEAWTEGDHAALKALTQLSLDLGITTLTYPSNQGAWGTFLEFAAAALLKDEARFLRTEREWRGTFSAYVHDNIPTHEVYRQGGTQGNGSSGLFYSNFLLCALTFGAEWARTNGVWLYDYVAPDGSSLRGLYENVARWTRSPATFSYNTSGSVSVVSEIQGHYEILHALWPNADAAWLLANVPVVDRYGFRYLTLTHRGQPLRG
ncbi:alginate lyase family protein [Arthrobacter sp. MDT3-44]